MRTYSDRACLLFRASLFCFLFYAAAIAAHAQSEPRWEVFTGFSYARLSLGYQSTIFQPTDQNYYGMHLSGSFNANRYLRIVLCDFGVQTSGTAVNLSPLTTDLSTSQVLFGPEFVLRSGSSAPFVHTLVGLTNTRLVSSVNHAYGSYYDEARRTNLALRNVAKSLPRQRPASSSPGAANSPVRAAGRSVGRAAETSNS